MEDIISKIFNLDRIIKYSKYTEMFRNPSEISMEQVLPEYIYLDYVRDCEELYKDLEMLDEDNFHLRLKEYIQFFNLLEKIKINGISYKAFCEVEKNETVLSTLNSFKPVNGFANKVSYNLTGTVTGRLVVKKSSPNVLILPSRCRKIFDSSYGREGSLYNIDFVSLEPRVARKVLNKECEVDIYEDIKNNLDMIVDRSIIKKAIISVLYGKHSDIQGISKEKSDLILKSVKEYFSLKELYEISNKIYFNKFRKNFYGRPILNLEEERTNRIINNFIQSTAVDVSLTYFSQITEQFKEKIRPLFVLHDALIVDVHNDNKEEFFKEVKKGFICPKLGYFPIEITNIKDQQ